MAPHAIENLAIDNDVSIASLKNKTFVKHGDGASKPKPPVADNFMYDFKYNHALPTSDILGIEIPFNCDAQKEAEAIVTKLAKTMGTGAAQSFTELFLAYG